jgi:hypothetical protein
MTAGVAHDCSYAHGATAVHDRPYPTKLSADGRGSDPSSWTNTIGYRSGLSSSAAPVIRETDGPVARCRMRDDVT